VAAPQRCGACRVYQNENGLGAVAVTVGPAEQAGIVYICPHLQAGIYRENYIAAENVKECGENPGGGRWHGNSRRIPAAGRWQVAAGGGM